MNILKQYYNIPINQRGHSRYRDFTRPRTQIAEFFEILNIFITKNNLKIEKRDYDRISTYIENISKYIYLEYLKDPQEEENKITFYYSSGINNQTTISIINDHNQVAFNIIGDNFEIYYCKKNIFISILNENKNIQELYAFEDEFPVKKYDQENIIFCEDVLKKSKIGKENNGKRLINFLIHHQYQYPNIDDALEPSDKIYYDNDYSNICSDINDLIRKLIK